MSQNLALDLSTSKTLTNMDTDLNTKTSWNPGHNTQTTEGSTWIAGDAAPKSYHAEEYRLYYRDGTTKSSMPTISDEEHMWEKTGNYYNWNAATAEAGTLSLSNTTVEDSICPKNWRLPLGTTANKSQYYLVTTYGLTAGLINATPFNYVLAGAYAINASQVLYDEIGGYMWSATARPSTTAAYGLYVWRAADYTTGGVEPQYSADSSDYIKNAGFSVRCVSR